MRAYVEPRVVTALLVLPALAWLAGLRGAEAGVNVWTTNGPYGGRITSLAIDPQTPSTLYAGTGGVFKSADGGTTWVNIGLTDTYVLALARSPRSTRCCWIPRSRT